MTNSKQFEIYNIIGRNIKKYRILRGYTQRSLSEALNLSESFIAKLESRTSQTISVDTLLMIAEFFDVDITEFFNKDTKYPFGFIFDIFFLHILLMASLIVPVVDLFLFLNCILKMCSISYLKRCHYL